MTFIRWLFLALLIFFTYHLIRDILQIFNIDNLFTSIGHRSHNWCKPYCNYVTIPLEIFGIVTSFLVLKRNEIGIFGKVLILSLPIWLIFNFLR